VLLYGISPSSQEKSCVVDFCVGMQFPFWCALQAYPTLGQPCGGWPKLFSGVPCAVCLPSKAAYLWQVIQDEFPGATA
jgi:hypothetical protein